MKKAIQDMVITVVMTTFCVAAWVFFTGALAFYLLLRIAS